jgi:hypothetical protein
MRRDINLFSKFEFIKTQQYFCHASNTARVIGIFWEGNDKN